MEEMPSKVAQLLQSTPVVPDFESKWSDFGRRMIHLTLRGLSTLHATKKSIRLDVGQPNPKMSLVTDIKVTLNDGSDVTVDDYVIDILGYYGHPSGIPGLRQWLTELQRREHNPPMLSSSNHPVKFGLVVCPGITHALSSTIKAILNTDFTDTIIMEDVAYASFKGALVMHGCNIEGMTCDDKGPIPDSLENLLSNWNASHPGRTLPKVLYTITAANNPRGYNWDEIRMVEIYLICRKYDLLIIDDAAYHFLQFGKRPLTFQAIDVDGRVIRMDTFSKVLGAGYRVGWISGAEQIMDKITIDHELTCIHSSMVAQGVVYAVLNNWGPEKFDTHMKKVAAFYEKQAGYLMSAFKKYLTGLATWTIPRGGMFTWLSIIGIEDSRALLDFFRTEEYDVIVVPGFHFTTEPGKSNSFRVSYSVASEEEMDMAAKSMADGIMKFKKDGKNTPNGSVQR